jgi:hypothetical protein
MCPACLTTVALIAAGATSAGGLTALGVKTLRALAASRAPATSNPEPGAPSHGNQPEDRIPS